MYRLCLPCPAIHGNPLQEQPDQGPDHNVPLHRGGILVTVYLTLLIWKPHMIMDFNGLFLISSITIFLVAGCGLIHVHLSRYFRHYLTGQLDIDMIIFDKLDPRVSDWTGFTHRVNSMDRR